MGRNPVTRIIVCRPLLFPARCKMFLSCRRNCKALDDCQLTAHIRLTATGEARTLWPRHAHPDRGLRVGSRIEAFGRGVGLRPRQIASCEVGVLESMRSRLVRCTKRYLADRWSRLVDMCLTCQWIPVTQQQRRACNRMRPSSVGPLRCLTVIAPRQ